MQPMHVLQPAVDLSTGNIICLWLLQGGWATLGVLGLLWGCTNYTGKVTQQLELQPYSCCSSNCHVDACAQ